VPVFAAIAEAMTAIREGAPEDPDDLLREAYMRTVLREVRRGHENIAVVCGAWHVPALTRKAPVKDDTALLKDAGRARSLSPGCLGRTDGWPRGRVTGPG
jgi:hypothetical protein